jgi:S-adenosylmethionine decarboxylase
MRDLAPEIFRQRLLVEGRYGREIGADEVRAFLEGLAAHLGMRAYGEPTIHSPAGEGKAQNQGYDAFLPLVDSGIALYVWTAARFFSVVIFTCKPFDVAAALDFTREHFAVQGDIAHREF